MDASHGGLHIPDSEVTAMDNAPTPVPGRAI